MRETAKQMKAAGYPPAAPRRASGGPMTAAPQATATPQRRTAPAVDAQGFVYVPAFRPKLYGPFPRSKSAMSEFSLPLVCPSNCGCGSFTEITATSPSRTSSPVSEPLKFFANPDDCA